MPRGRPPLKRTKEQALTARREQIRKNVQTFRRRKQTQHNSDEPCTDVNLQNGHTLVLEELGHAENQVKHQRPWTQEEALTHLGTRQFSDDLSTPLFWQGSLPQYPSEPYKCPSYLVSNAAFGVSLPPSIDTGPSTLQQFTSNVVCTFPPAHEWKGAHWSQTIPSLVNRNQTLDLSIQALCLLQLGHIHSDQQFLPISLSIYNSAVKSLKSALARPTHHFNIEIFIATLALGLYELLQGTNTQGGGWLIHFEGGTAYLNRFHPPDVSLVGHQILFHFLETIVIFDALAIRKPSCLTNSKWWRDSVDRFCGDHYGPLIRMLTSLPGVLEQCDLALSSESSATACKDWMRVLRICLRLEDAFLGWFSQENDNQQPNTSRQDLGTPFDSNRPSTVEFKHIEETDSGILLPNICVARLYLLYWASMILLYDSIIAILDKLRPDNSNSNPLSIPITQSTNANISPQAYATSCHGFAMSILRSTPFCVEPKHGMAGKSLILLPLFVARKHLRRVGHEEEAKRCDEWLESFGQREIRFGLNVRRES